MRYYELIQDEHTNEDDGVMPQRRVIKPVNQAPANTKQDNGMVVITYDDMTPSQQRVVDDAVKGGGTEIPQGLDTPEKMLAWVKSMRK